MTSAKRGDAAGLTEAERKTLRLHLERERAAALEVLRSNEHTARSAEPEIEAMDAVEVTREQDDGALLVGRTRAHLREVGDALARLDAGTYGISERTGEPIGYRRLEAIPWTRLGADEE